MTSYNDILACLSNEELKKVRERINGIKVNVLLVGGTGVGKSSTIHALFKESGMESGVKIGDSTKPETMEIARYDLGNFVIWDTPGLGDTPANDARHREIITELLKRTDAKGNPVIDLVLLILDAGSRDYSSAFTLIKDVIHPNLTSQNMDRLLIAVNQADMAMKGRYWDKIENKPEQPLVDRLDELVQTIRERIQADTALGVDPIYYSAGCVINGETLSKPYNLQKLLSYFVELLPQKKRIAIVAHINEKKENFASNDNKSNYEQKIEKSMFSSLTDFLKDVAGEVGSKVGVMLKDVVTDPQNIKTALTFAIGLFLKKK